MSFMSCTCPWWVDTVFNLQKLSVYVVMHILQLWSKKAILQATFVTEALPRIPNKLSLKRDRNAKPLQACWIMQSHLTNQHIKSNRNTQDGFPWPCRAFKSLLPFWISASVRVCHHLIQATLWRGICSGLPASAGLAACCTNTMRRMFIFRQPNADCTLSDLINVEKCGETLLGLRHQPGKVSRN